MLAKDQTENPLLRSIEEAAGPIFAWLRIESTQSFCLFKARENVFPAVAFPFGKRNVIETLTGETGITKDPLEAILSGSHRRNASPEIIDACARLTRRSKAEASEAFANGSISRDPALRTLASRHLRPLAERMKESLRSIEERGTSVPVIVLEMEERVAPILLHSLQDLLPDRYLLSIESLGVENFTPEMSDRSDSSALSSFDARRNAFAEPPPPSPQSPSTAILPMTDAPPFPPETPRRNYAFLWNPFRRIRRHRGEPDSDSSHDEMANRLEISRHLFSRMASGNPCSSRNIRKMADRSRTPRSLFLLISGYEPNLADRFWDKTRYRLKESWKYEELTAGIGRDSAMTNSRANRPAMKWILLTVCLFLLPFLILGILLLFMPA